MQNFQNDPDLYGLPMVFIIALTMIMTTLMFLSFFLTSIPQAM